jgi:hypothetical protein
MGATEEDIVNENLKWKIVVINIFVFHNKHKVHYGHSPTDM